MNPKTVIDTNVIIDNPDILLESDDYAISYVTLQEIDKLKSNPELNYAARTAIKVIWEKLNNSTIEILNVPTENTTNDELIVQDAKDINGYIMSNDIGALVVAKSKGVKTFNPNSIGKEYDRVYKGYYEIIIPEDLFYSFTDNTIELGLLAQFFKEIPPINSYIVIYTGDNTENYIVVRRSENLYDLVHKTSKDLKTAGVKLKWLHPEQLIAFDCVANNNTKLAVITGKIGTSKTLMSLCGAIATTFGRKTNKLYDRILVTRPNIPINRRFELGFRPGGLEDKMEEWLAPFKTNLQFLFETNEKDVREEKAKMVYSEYFRALPIESIQGASIHNSIIIVDEAQLLDVNTLRQVMSRIANGSKLVLIMDPKQTYGANRGMEGYKKLLPHCKNNKHISFVELQHIQRSELTKVVNEIFE